MNANVPRFLSQLYAVATRLHCHVTFMPQSRPSTASVQDEQVQLLTTGAALQKESSRGSEMSAISRGEVCTFMKGSHGSSAALFSIQER